MPEGFREEVLNVTLSDLLYERGAVSLPEQHTHGAGHRQMPDVMVEYQGLRVVLEGKVDDHDGAPEEVMGDARHRVETGLAHIAVAVLYPEALRHARSRQVLSRKMEASVLRIAVISEAGLQGWADADVNYLAAMLRRTFEQLVLESVVNRAVQELELGIDGYVQAVRSLPGAVARTAEELGISLALDAEETLGKELP